MTTDHQARTLPAIDGPISHLPAHNLLDSLQHRVQPATPTGKISSTPLAS